MVHPKLGQPDKPTRQDDNTLPFGDCAFSACEDIHKIKYVDDTTEHEVCHRDSPGNMQEVDDNTSQWSHDNKMSSKANPFEDQGHDSHFQSGTHKHT